jgi:hypothetical protein
MAINISVNLGNPAGVVSSTISYARIDNLLPGQTPTFITIPNVTTYPYSIQNLPAGQYQVNAVKNYADVRTCAAETQTSPPCPGLISFNATVSGNVMTVSYLAPSTVPNIQVTVNYPNGGSFSQMYVNNGNNITIALPPNVYGNYAAFGQSVCDATSGFLSGQSNTVNITVNQSIPGTYRLENTAIGTCGAAITTLYTSGVFAAGGTLFYDTGLTTPVTTFSYVLNINDGNIYNLTAGTGLIGTSTGQTCTSTGTVFIQNFNSAYSIANVNFIAGFAFGTPLTTGLTQSGTHTAFLQGIEVIITGSDVTCCLLLIINNIVIQSIPITLGSSYTFNDVSVAATDNLKIILQQGTCI